MKLWEVIKELTEDPTKKFEAMIRELLKPPYDLNENERIFNDMVD